MSAKRPYTVLWLLAVRELRMPLCSHVMICSQSLLSRTQLTHVMVVQVIEPASGRMGGNRFLFPFLYAPASPWAVNAAVAPKFLVCFSSFSVSLRRIVPKMS